MPDLGYFGKLTGAVVLGLVTLLLSALAVLVLLPYLIPLLSVLLPFLAGASLMVFAVLIIWTAVYISALIGIFIYYIFKPMNVKKRGKGYSISGAREAGKRRKGNTRKK